MAKARKLDRFDHCIPASPTSNPWQTDGSFRTDLDTLERLLAIAVGSSQRSGVVAGAADVWAAEELRRAGFEADAVWPRRTAPRVVPRDVRNLVAVLPKKLRVMLETRIASGATRGVLPAEAHVMGRAYTKQSDVLIASWPAGVEVLISTKTMLSSFNKNLRNRFEEGYGDAKNIRGRHPLAALGFLFLAAADISEEELLFAIDMLRKLTLEPDVYDCACLLVVDGMQGVEEEEEEGDTRGVTEEPSALIPQPSTDNDDSLDHEPASQREGTEREDPEAPETREAVAVRVVRERVPKDLSADAFFQTLINAALDLMPVAVYQDVRKLRSEAIQES